MLPIGGVKEKTIAAQRSGVKTIIFPEANRKDWDELEDYLKKGLSPHFADTYDDVFRVAFPSLADSVQPLKVPLVKKKAA